MPGQIHPPRCLPSSTISTVIALPLSTIIPFVIDWHTNFLSSPIPIYFVLKLIKLAQFRGAITLKILQEFGNFSEYTALQVKKAVTGNGKAQKEQVAFMVKRLLNIKKEIKPLDITDAMAIAITHTQRVRMKG